MNVYHDFKRIVDQILGKGNMFEYQTTLANQAYLLYSLLGRIYTTDKIHRHTKQLLIFAFASIVTLGTSEIVFYLVFYTNEDFLTQMYALFVISSNAFLITIVIMNYMHRRHIETTIGMMDKLVARSSINSYIGGEQINVKVWLYIPLIFLATSLPFMLGCIIDVAIFYDESKVKNNMYYIVPIPNLERYGSLGLYVVVNVGTGVIGGTLLFATLTTIILPFMWAVVCHNEVQRIVYDLSSLSENHHATTASDASFERKFKATIVHCIHAYRDVINTISCLRGYYETMASILLPFCLLFSVIHAHIFTTSTYSIIVNMKEFSVLFCTLQVIYSNCWIGETLEEMTNTMSFAIYSTPWYMSTKVRKDAYIFLCQTQNSINPTAWSVYPLSLATFLRFMNVVQSSVNILRAVATK